MDHAEIPKPYAHRVYLQACSKAQRKKWKLYTGRSGSYTQETPHGLMDKQKKPRHTCYSAASNSHIPAPEITLFCSMM